MAHIDDQQDKEILRARLTMEQRELVRVRLLHRHSADRMNELWHRIRTQIEVVEGIERALRK